MKNKSPEIWSWPCGAPQVGAKAPSPPHARFSAFFFHCFDLRRPQVEFQIFFGSLTCVFLFYCWFLILIFFRMTTCDCRKSNSPVFWGGEKCVRWLICCFFPNFFPIFPTYGRRKSLICRPATLQLKVAKCRLAASVSRKNEKKWKKIRAEVRSWPCGTRQLGAKP